MTSLRLRWISFFLFTATLITASAAIVRSTAFSRHPDLIAVASTLDIILIVPLVYFLLAPAMKTRRITVIPVFVLCIALASLIIPEGHHQTLEIIAVSAELTAITILVRQVLRIRKEYRSIKDGSSDFYDCMNESLRRIIPFERAAKIILTEVSLMYYSSVGWFSRTNEDSPVGFSTYKESGYTLVASVVVGLLCFETILVHLFLVQWRPEAAWVVTGLSIYALVFFFGDLNALRRRPLLINENGIMLRVGIRWTAFIPFESIQRIVTTRIPALAEGPHLNVALLRNSNCNIYLHEPVTVSGLYGTTKIATSIALSIDDVARFMVEMRKSIPAALPPGES